MTQLVGVLCEKRTKVVMVSDRMVTTSDGSLAFEHEAKSERLAPNALVLVAGTVHEPELITDTRNEIKGVTPILEIAEKLSERYGQLRLKRIESEVLRRVGIPSLAVFYQMQQGLHDSNVFELSKSIRDYDLGLALLLGGVDERAHLYRIGEPGTYRSFDQLGFCCIGSGDRHADPVFAFYRFSPDITLEGALTIAFEAKKKAEMAGGVGRNTDAWVLDDKGIHVVSTDTIKNLEDSHGKQQDASTLLPQIKIKLREDGTNLRGGETQACTGPLSPT